MTTATKVERRPGIGYFFERKAKIAAEGQLKLDEKGDV
jgi:hypothetical protein